MKALIQRVTRGSVVIDGQIVAEIGRGYVVLLGVRQGDGEEDARYLAHRTVNLRVFSDEDGKMNRSIEDVAGRILVVSQFTLYADTKKGNRPSFVRAGDPKAADELYQAYVAALRRALGEERVRTGRFGDKMTVEIVNDGPVTIELNTDRNWTAEG